MAADPKDQPIPMTGDVSSNPAFQQPLDPNSIHMQQTPQGPPPPVYMSSPTPAHSQPQFAQPQYAQPQFAQPQFAQPQFAQPQFAQPQPQYQFIQLPDGQWQAVPTPQQPVVMMSPAQPAPAKEQPTIIVNNAASSSASAAAAAGAGGDRSTTDACLAGACGACAACLCCTVM